ncbi:HEAT repeat domain-containing protein [bacterium]|nr:HEAT repeat domain-containing protein [bacterium]
MRRILVLFVVIGCLVGGLSYAQPKISKGNIPVNIPAEVREQIERLYSSNPKEREAAVRSFYSMGEKATPAVPFLISVLKDKDLHVRWYAASTLGHIEDSRAVKPLIAVLRKDKDSRVRECAAVSLMYLKDPRAVEQLIVALKDENKSVRYAATLALGSIKDSKAVESINCCSEG